MCEITSFFKMLVTTHWSPSPLIAVSRGALEVRAVLLELGWMVGKLDAATWLLFWSGALFHQGLR